MDLDPRAARTMLSGVRQGTTPGDPTPAEIGQTAAWMAQTRFGGPTRVFSHAETLTTTWSQLVGNNPRRVFIAFINRATVNAAVDSDPSATFSNGILMGAGGGYVSYDVQDDGETVAGAFFGACETSTATVRIVEVIRV